MKQNLLKTASRLTQPPESALTEFRVKHESLAESCTQKMVKRSDLDKLIGKGNLEMMSDNNRNFSRFMLSLFTEYNPDVLVETVLWVFQAYRSHGFQTTFWAAHLNTWMEQISSELSNESLEAISPFYHWLIVNIPIFSKLTDETIAEFSDDGG